MNKMENQAQDNVIVNIIKILNDKNLPKAELCVPLDITESSVSKLMNGKTKLTYNMLSKIAEHFSMREIDIITYPDVYVRNTQGVEAEPVEATLQIKLKKDKKDQVLKLVFGENNLEILNK